MQDLVTPLNESLEFWHNKAVQVFGLKNWKCPKLDIVSLRGTTAGKAFLTDNLVKVNWTLYTQNQKQFLNNGTMPHEVAHLVNYQLNGPRQDGHGPQWRAVMRRLGIENPTKCHSYDTSSVRDITVIFPYKCDRCGYEGNLSSKAHYTLLTNKTNRVTCVKCFRGNFQYLGKSKSV